MNEDKYYRLTSRENISVALFVLLGIYAGITSKDYGITNVYIAIGLLLGSLATVIMLIFCLNFIDIYASKNGAFQIKYFGKQVYVQKILKIHLMTYSSRNFGRYGLYSFTYINQSNNKRRKYFSMQIVKNDITALIMKYYNDNVEPK